MRAIQAFCLAIAAATAVVAAQGTDVRVRVFDTAAKREVVAETLLAAVVRADVVFLGETPADAATARVEAQLLQRLSQLRGDVFLVLEAFSRDVQEPLDHFQMGHVDDKELAAEAHLEPAVFARYKPILDHATTAKWPILAGNLPGRIAADVAASGLGTLKATHADDAVLFAKEWVCPTTTPRAQLAGCLAEETMAESVASAWAVASMGGKPPLVVAINDRARTDFRRGVVERTARRLPGRTIVTISIAPVASLEGAALGANAPAPADYVIWVKRD